MTVPELTERFAELESRIAEEKGPFALFALFMREDAPDRWDLIVSAPWAGEDKRSVGDYFVGQIKSRLGEQGLTSLSRIVVIDPQDAAVQALNRTIQIEHGRVEVRDSTFFGLTVKHAYIITSQRPQAPAAAWQPNKPLSLHVGPHLGSGAHYQCSISRTSGRSRGGPCVVAQACRRGRRGGGPKALSTQLSWRRNRQALMPTKRLARAISASRFG